MHDIKHDFDILAKLLWNEELNHDVIYRLLMSNFIVVVTVTLLCGLNIITFTENDQLRHMK